MSTDHAATETKRFFNKQDSGANANWRRVLDAHQVRFLVLNLDSEDDMVRFFRSQAGWSVDFEDGESIIFVRDDADRVLDSRRRILEGAI
jgi:hypothetical protein